MERENKEISWKIQPDLWGLAENFSSLCMLFFLKTWGVHQGPTSGAYSYADCDTYKAWQNDVALAETNFLNHVIYHFKIERCETFHPKPVVFLSRSLNDKKRLTKLPPPVKTKVFDSRRHDGTISTFNAGRQRSSSPLTILRQRIAYHDVLRLHFSQRRAQQTGGDAAEMRECFRALGASAQVGVSFELDAACRTFRLHSVGFEFWRAHACDRHIKISSRLLSRHFIINVLLKKRYPLIVMFHFQFNLIICLPRTSNRIHLANKLSYVECAT